MILNLDELIYVADSEDSVWLEPSLIVYIDGTDVSSLILHGYETYPIMELIERKPFVVPPNKKICFLMDVNCCKTM